MKKHKLFFDVKKEQEWLSEQTGWKLIWTNGFRYDFVESHSEYVYEYVFFEKSKNELDAIVSNVADPHIEFVTRSSSWALFRKDHAQGEIQVLATPYDKYRNLMKKYDSYMGLGACYMGLGSSQVALSATLNPFFGIAGSLCFACSCMFFVIADRLKRYTATIDDGTFAAIWKMDRKR